MPGISDRSALQNAVHDSLVFSSKTVYRLRGRGVRDVKAAIRLRRFEVDILKEYDRPTYDDIASVSETVLKEKIAGNKFVYQFMLFALKVTADKDLLRALRSKDVLRLSEMANILMQVKIPEHIMQVSHSHMPERYGIVHARYITLRTIYSMMKTLHSESGMMRGKFQHLSTTFKDDDIFKKEMVSMITKYREKSDIKIRKSPMSYKIVVTEGLKFEMTRLSDLIYLNIYFDGDNFPFLFTSNHFDRSLMSLVQMSNVDIGLTMGYGMDEPSLGANVAECARRLIKRMTKLGFKDDLSVGEAGKAMTDLYKAKLSQTDELPWNNYNLLARTYSDKRCENAEYLLDDFMNYDLDPDVKLNLSYIWKLSHQPDSDILMDFEELSEGLSSPNSIKEGAADLLEFAIRRAVLVGAVRENRQVTVTACSGSEVPHEVQRLVRSSRVRESDIRGITFGMMKNVKVFVPEVFPSVHDTSHLTFKDKSSSVEGVGIRKQVDKYYIENQRLSQIENQVLMEHAHLAAENFLSKISFCTEIDEYDRLLAASSNDIITSIDESLAGVFNEAESKFKTLTRSLSKYRSQYGGPGYQEMIREWARENPELLINTGTEPKLGEVHKRTVRIFYMFEKGMKTFLSQFERIARLVDFYIKGAEIVKGDRAREKHMNILSSAYKATNEGILAYQILFDLSKFSQKFNHLLIDAAGKVIGELVDYPDYANISDLFKASFLYVSARNVNKSFVGVLGSFEGFLNFLWTGIHATVMDIALRDCGRSGDLAAYSDDGLLMFTMKSTLESPRAAIQEELRSVISSITKTYSDFGLDFNLGKTMISRNLAEFLGIIQYKGKRLPTWMKELAKLGIPDERKSINSLGGEVIDTSAQYSALIKAGMPPYAASFVAYHEIMMGSGRRLLELAAEESAVYSRRSYKGLRELSVVAFLSLLPAYGGIRVPDPLVASSTADYDPVSEMLMDIKTLIHFYPKTAGLSVFLRESLSSTSDYTSLIMGSSPINTDCVGYSPNFVRDQVLKMLKNKLPELDRHPLSREKAPDLHECLEAMESIYLPTVVSLCSYVTSVIEYNKILAPYRASSMVKLLKKNQIRMIQSRDTAQVRKVFAQLIHYMILPESVPIISAKEVYTRSYPKLKILSAVPSYRDLVKLGFDQSQTSYVVSMQKLARQDNKGSGRLLNMAYRDELVPPLITSDVNIVHLTNTADLTSHCVRGLFSELVNASSQGHDITPLVDILCHLNGAGYVPPSVVAGLYDMRKLAVANRKKTIHRVYWSMASKTALRMTRMGGLNYIMTQSTNTHYSLIVTAALALSHMYANIRPSNQFKSPFYIHVNPEAALLTKMSPMRFHPDSKFIITTHVRETRVKHNKNVSSSVSISNEVNRAIEASKLELRDNILSGRMGMLADFRALIDKPSLTDPLRYAIVWSLISRLDNVIATATGKAGISSVAIATSTLDGLPMELVNYAIIFRAYKEVHKGILSKYLKSSDHNKKPVLPEVIAEETLYAASQLGLVTSVTVDTLRSEDSAIIYDSMIKANNIDLVYYSLDTHSEGNSTTTVSQPRAKAAGRVLDALISKEFVDREYSPWDDFRRMVMMIARGCIRGSVHRPDPFNKRVVRDWTKYFMSVIVLIHHVLPRECLTPIMRKGIETYQGISDDMVPKVLRIINNTDSVIMMPKLGSIEQFAQVRSYLVNLSKWGVIPAIYDIIDFDESFKYADSVIKTKVLPALAMSRTISYSALESAISMASDVPLTYRSPADSLDIVTARIVSELGREATVENLIGSLAQHHYRSKAGPFNGLDIHVETADAFPFFIPSALAYSMSLPLLLATGISGYSSVVDITSKSMAFGHKALETWLSEYSLPIIDPLLGVPLSIIKGVSEAELVEALMVWDLNRSGQSMVVVEIPPNAGAVSLGVIRKLSDYKYSHVSIGLSSDYKGISIYVSALLDKRMDLRRHSDLNIKTTPSSLGDLAVEGVVKAIIDGNVGLINSFSTTPLHQCGIPVSLAVYMNGEYQPVEVDEELIDKTRVSFVETGRPSDNTLSLARVPTASLAHLIRAFRVKNSKNDPYPRAVLASAHYYHAVVPDISVKEFINIVSNLVNSFDSESDQLLVITKILDPLLSMPPIMLSDLPTAAQVAEVSLENPPLPDEEYFSSLDFHLNGTLKISGSSTLPEDERGKLADYLQIVKDKYDYYSLREIVAPKEGPKKKKMGGRLIVASIEEEVSMYSAEALARVDRTVVKESLKIEAHPSADISAISRFLTTPFELASDIPLEEAKPTEPSLADRIREIGFPESTVEEVLSLPESVLNSLKEMGDMALMTELMEIEAAKLEESSLTGGLF